MSDIDSTYIYIPNTEVLHKLLASLNYTITPIGTRGVKKSSDYPAICFSHWIASFKEVQQTTKMYYCDNNPNLTTEQSIFIFNILHICPDYQTFKEALEQYIKSNP